MAAGDAEDGPAAARLRCSLDARTRRWAMYEFFCSALDRPWLLGCELRDWLAHIGVEPSTVPACCAESGCCAWCDESGCCAWWIWGSGAPGVGPLGMAFGFSSCESEAVWPTSAWSPPRCLPAVLSLGAVPASLALGRLVRGLEMVLSSCESEAVWPELGLSKL